MVALRRVNKHDRELLFKWRNLPAVRSRMMTSREIELVEHDRWFEEILVGNDREQWIILSDGIPVGSVYLTGLGETPTTPSFGIYVGDASTRGAGVGRETLGILFSDVFSRDHIVSIEAQVLSNNDAACRLYERIGMWQLEPESGHEYGIGVMRYIMTKQVWRRTIAKRSTGNES